MHLRNIQLLAIHEAGKSVSTPKGRIFTALAFLCWSFLLLYPVLYLAGLLDDPGSASLINGILEANGSEWISRWPVPEYGIFWGLALFLTPALAIVYSSDQIISDRNHGTLRFYLLRTSRNALFLGRFLGQLYRLLIVLLIPVVFLFLIMLADTGSHAVLSADLILIPFITLIAMMPFVALLSLGSTFFQSARNNGVLISLFLLLFPLLSSMLPAFAEQIIDWLNPAAFIWNVYSVTPLEGVTYIWLPVLQTVLFLLAGMLRMKDLTV